MSKNRVEELIQKIDELVDDTVVQSCADKVCDRAVPLIEAFIKEKYGLLPKVIEIHDKGEIRKITGTVHEVFETVLKLVSFDLPVYLSGEAGSVRMLSVSK